MKLKIRKIIRQIRAGEFGQVALSEFPRFDPGHRRAVRPDDDKVIPPLFPPSIL